MSKLFILLVLAGVVTVLNESIAFAGGTQIQIAGKSSKPVRIVCPASAETKEMARYLSCYLKARGFSVQSSIASVYSATYKGPQWLLATQKSASSVKAPAEKLSFLSSGHDEAYLLDAQQEKNGPVILLVGKNINGLRAATSRLMCKAANYGDRLLIASGKEQNDPFIKQRLIYIGKAPRRQVPESSPFVDTDVERWPLQKISAYPELYWQFGFNGIEIAESRGYASLSDSYLVKVRRANQELARAARNWHFFVSLNQWGDCPFNEGETYSWNNPKEKAVLLSFIDDLANTYAPFVDHVNIHVGDPGGCTRDGCDFYKTPQQITTAFYDAFRKINPSVTAGLSTWANAEFWAHSPSTIDVSNYGAEFSKPSNFAHPIPDGAKFLDDTFMPKNASVALHRKYCAEQAEALIKAGRPVDIWGWYISDMEMLNNIWLNMRQVDGVFSTLPDKAREQIRSQSVEQCFHGWPQIINAYVAAQKLINPRRPLDEIEMEFCTASFGPSNAKPMMDLYLACENTRPYSNGICTDLIPKPAEFGTSAYVERLKSVLAEAATVSIDPAWKPNFAFPVHVQKYVDMLRARLQLIIAVNEAKCEIDKAKEQFKLTSISDEKQQETIAAIKKKAIDSLPDLPIDPLYKQDKSIVTPGYAATSFADMITNL